MQSSCNFDWPQNTLFRPDHTQLRHTDHHSSGCALLPPCNLCPTSTRRTHAIAHAHVSSSPSLVRAWPCCDVDTIALKVMKHEPGQVFFFSIIITSNQQRVTQPALHSFLHHGDTLTANRALSLPLSVPVLRRGCRALDTHSTQPTQIHNVATGPRLC